MSRLRKHKIYLFIFSLLAAIFLTIWLLSGNRSPYSSTVAISFTSSDTAITIVPSQKTVSSDVKTRKKVVKRTIQSEFSDKQKLHLAVAFDKGIEPVSDLKSAYNVRLPIVLIYPNEAYDIDSLKHSLPFLQPDAAKMLMRIGTLFSDSVTSRFGHRSRIRVTSVLRTDGAISRLRRLNRNAVENSAHRYGRTFDISYRNFTPDDSTYILNSEIGKNILANVLRKLRNDSLVYVKYEYKQGCFHITVR